MSNGNIRYGNQALPYQCDRHDPLNSLWVICEPHQVRNKAIHRNAMQLLSQGQPVASVIEYCRHAYAKASAEYQTENDKLNGVTVKQRISWAVQAAMGGLDESAT